MSVDKMTLDKTTVGKINVEKMPAYEITVNKMGIK